jgi:AraC-like DNA-binding protein
LNGSRIAGVLAESFAVRTSTSTATASSPHAQHGHALFVGLDRDVTITTAAGVLRGRVVLVPAGVRNAVDSPGRTIGICYDPERSPIAARDASVLDARLLAAPAGDHLADPDALVAVAGELHRRIAAQPRVLDRRVAAAVEVLRTPGLDHRRELAHLPVSRAHLRALFARDIGTPIPTYARWRRLLDALAVFGGSNATVAAHAAGFADLAHFSRTCRDMLGYSPTTLRG